MTRWLAIAALICLCWVGAASAAAVSLEGLLADLALASDARTIAYREIRSSGLLSEPVTLHGELTVFRDGRLVKRTRHPDGREAVVRIDGDSVSVTDDEGERTFALSRSPTLAALVGALRALASGDAAALRERFEVTVAGDRKHWRILLTRALPRPGITEDDRPDENEVEVRLSGQNARVERIRLRGRGRETTLELGTEAR